MFFNLLIKILNASQPPIQQVFIRLRIDTLRTAHVIVKGNICGALSGWSFPRLSCQFCFNDIDDQLHIDIQQPGQFPDLAEREGFGFSEFFNVPAVVHSEGLCNLGRIQIGEVPHSLYFSGKEH